MTSQVKNNGKSSKTNRRVSRMHTGLISVKDRTLRGNINKIQQAEGLRELTWVMNGLKQSPLRVLGQQRQKDQVGKFITDRCNHSGVGIAQGKCSGTVQGKVWTTVGTLTKWARPQVLPRREDTLGILSVPQMAQRHFLPPDSTSPVIWQWWQQTGTDKVKVRPVTVVVSLDNQLWNHNLPSIPKKGTQGLGWKVGKSDMPRQVVTDLAIRVNSPWDLTKITTQSTSRTKGRLRFIRGRSKKSIEKRAVWGLTIQDPPKSKGAKQQIKKRINHMMTDNSKGQVRAGGCGLWDQNRWRKGTKPGKMFGTNINNVSTKKARRPNVGLNQLCLLVHRNRQPGKTLESLDTIFKPSCLATQGHLPRVVKKDPQSLLWKGDAICTQRTNNFFVDQQPSFAGFGCASPTPTFGRITGQAQGSEEGLCMTQGKNAQLRVSGDHQVFQCPATFAYVVPPS